MSDRSNPPPPTKKRPLDALSPMLDTGGIKKFKLDRGPMPVFSPQDVASIGTPLPPLFKTGTAFSQGVGALRDGGNEMVSTEFALRVKPPDVVTGTKRLRTNVEPERQVTVQGTLSLKHHNTGLTQGWLNSPSNTAYSGEGYNGSVLPVNLSMQRATLESRAIKKLSPGGEHYDPLAKTSTLDELEMNTTKSPKTKSFFPEKNTLGMFALGSHLEDITAKRALGLEDVGSAMRAKLMATKWKMRVDGNDNAGMGFQKTMLDAFPQLGKQPLAAAGLPSSGISALMEHWSSGGTTFSKDDQVANIGDAHREATTFAGNVFEHKVGLMLGGTPLPGKWWGANASRIQTHLPGIGSSDAETRNQATAALSEIGQEYVERKLDRHGIRRG